MKSQIAAPIWRERNPSIARRMEALERSVAALDADTRKQFDQVYEAILGLMGSGPRKQ